MPSPESPALPLDAESIARMRLVVLRLARRLRQQADGQATPAQMSALATIVRVGPVSLGDLASLEQVGPSTLTKIVAALEASGLVTRSTAPDDRRVALVTASDAGRKQLREWRSSAAHYLVEQLAILEPGELAALEAALPALERLVKP